MEKRTVYQKAAYQSKKVRVRDKGQLTIPFEFRKKFGIEEDTVVDVYQVGRAIIVAPENLLVRELARSVKGEMGDQRISLEDLLSELREGRHEYQKE